MYIESLNNKEEKLLHPKATRLMAISALIHFYSGSLQILKVLQGDTGPFKT